MEIHKLGAGTLRVAAAAAAGFDMEAEAWDDDVFDAAAAVVAVAVDEANGLD